MKAMRVLGTVMAIGLGLSAITVAGDVHAQGKKGKKEAAPPPAPAEAPDIKPKKPITLIPAGFIWGMSPKQVAEAVDKILDEDYKPLFQKTAIGVNQRSLEAQLVEDKSAFRRSRIDFGKLPTGIDSTPLRGEYTYLNKESLMTLDRKDQPRWYFFFIQDKLWKIIAEHKLTQSSPMGKTWEEAVLKLVKTYGVVGRLQEADYDKGRNATEVDWKDAATHLRAIQRSDTALAIAYEDRATVSNLSNLRVNKPAQTDDIDPAVKAATSRGSEEPPPPPAPVDKAGAGKKVRTGK